MASSNIKLFDENKGNMLNDTEFNISTQRLNGLQTGVASSQLQNKAMYQASLMAYAIAQLMLANGKNANDTDAVSTFVNNLLASIVQKVADKATKQDVTDGIAGKWISSELLKSNNEAISAALSKETNERTAADSSFAGQLVALEQKVKFIKLGAATTTAAGQSMTVDLSGVDMSQYEAMFLLTQAYIDASGARELRLSLNGTSAGNVFSSYDKQDANFRWLMPIGTTSVCIFGPYGNSANYVRTAAVAWNSIQTLTLSCSSGGTVAAGASCVLYGFKA